MICVCINNVLEVLQWLVHLDIDETSKVVKLVNDLSLSFEKRVLDLGNQIFILRLLVIEVLQVVRETVCVKVSLIIKLIQLETYLLEILSEAVMLTFYLVLKVATDVFLLNNYIKRCGWLTYKFFDLSGKHVEGDSSLMLLLSNELNFIKFHLHFL
jgi:hypothetical protein